MDPQAAEGQGGYAKQMDEEFYRRQRELLGKVIAANDVVISTAAIPGKKAPLLITADAVCAMQPASVIVDLAAQSGGNCELTKPGETTVVNGVSILAPTNLPSEVPQHASQMFSRNVATFITHLIRDGQFVFDASDPIVAETLITRGGNVVHAGVRKLLGFAGEPGIKID